MRRLVLISGSFFKKHRVLFLQITVSAILCFFLLSLFPVDTARFYIHHSDSVLKQKDYEYQFADFDGDGTGNVFVLKYNESKKENGVLVFDNDSSLIDQWNFYERWLPDFSVFGDFDNDRNLEFYVFTKDNDSLFLYVIDPRIKPNFFKKRIFLASSNNADLNPAGIWDVFVYGVQFIDSDEDGFRDVIISLTSGYSQQPRKVIVCSLAKERVIATTPTWGIMLGQPKLAVVDNSDTLIYFSSSAAPYNIHTEIKYKDDHTWLVVLNRRLQLLFNPIPFGKEFTTIQIYFTYFASAPKFVVIQDAYGLGERDTRLFLVTLDGAINHEMTLSRSDYYGLFQIPDYSDSVTFLSSSDSLFIVGDNLKLNFLRKIPSPVYFLSAENLRSNYESDYLFTSAQKYFVSDSTIRYFTEISHFQNADRYKIHVLNKKGFSYLILDTPDKLHLLSYKPNPWYPYRYLYPAGLFAVCFGFVFGGYVYAKKRIFHNHFSDQLFQNAQRGIILLDHSGKISKMNSAVGELLKTENPLHKSNKFSERFSDYPELKEVFSAMAIHNRSLVREMTLQQKDETLRLQINGYPLHKENSEPVGYLIEILDYSDPIHKERMNMWSDTVKRFAHDLKTPLSSLFLMADNMNLKICDYPPEIRPEMQEELKIFTNEIQRLKKMTKRFAQFSEFQKANFTQIQISWLIQSALDGLFSLFTSAITIDNQTTDSSVVITGDVLQLQQVLQILIKNSIEALNGKGKILIRASVAQNLKSITQDSCIIEVCDTGSGISSEHKSKMFEPFFTTKADGSGLGLSIAKKVVLEHHGQIYISNDDYFSTIVRVVLPTGNNGAIDV